MSRTTDSSQPIRRTSRLVSRIRSRLPNCRRACDSASSRGTPARMRSAARASTWNRCSSSRSTSRPEGRKARTSRLSKDIGTPFITRDHVDYPASGQLEDLRHSRGHAAPALFLSLQMFAAGWRDLIDARAPFVFRQDPFGPDLPGFLQTVQSRIERAFLDAQRL